MSWCARARDVSVIDCKFSWIEIFEKYTRYPIWFGFDNADAVIIRHHYVININL